MSRRRALTIALALLNSFAGLFVAVAGLRGEDAGVSPAGLFACGAFWIFAGPLGVWAESRVWRGKAVLRRDSLFDVPGEHRAKFVIGASGSISLPLIIVVAVVLPEDGLLLFIGGAVMLFALFFPFVLWATVLLFNRPRVVVPPHLRDEPGAIEKTLRG